MIKFIQEELGERSPNARYSYSDLILSRCYTTFCGGACAEDIDYMKPTLDRLKGMKVPSADTILRMETELGQPTGILLSINGNENQVNINAPLNRLLVKAATRLKILDPAEKEYCLYFDHQFIPTEKHDTTYSYKKEKGYFPAVASIGNTPVYIEGRNGNCHVKFNQLDTIKRAYETLGEQGIRPARCRMDSGSYIKELCDWIEAGQTKFYIRASQSETLLFNASVA